MNYKSILTNVPQDQLCPECSGKLHWNNDFDRDETTITLWECSNCKKIFEFEV